MWSTFHNLSGCHSGGVEHAQFEALLMSSKMRNVPIVYVPQCVHLSFYTVPSMWGRLFKERTEKVGKGRGRGGAVQSLCVNPVIVHELARINIDLHFLHRNGMHGLT